MSLDTTFNSNQALIINNLSPNNTYGYYSESLLDANQTTYSIFSSSNLALPDQNSTEMLTEVYNQPQSNIFSSEFLMPEIGLYSISGADIIPSYGYEFTTNLGLEQLNTLIGNNGPSIASYSPQGIYGYPSIDYGYASGGLGYTPINYGSLPDLSSG